MVRRGPSPEAIERLDSVLLAIYDSGGPLTAREIKARLSEFMSRNDLESALKRLRGANMVGVVPGSHPWAFDVTRYGRVVAQQRVEAGKGY